MPTAARVTNRKELKAYALRALGAPVLRINVDDAQMEDRIDDALDLFWQHHMEGSEQVYLKYQLTQADIDAGEITLPDTVQAVSRVLPIGGASRFGVQNLQYVAYFQDMMQPSFFATQGLSGYGLTMTYLDTIQYMFDEGKLLSFNSYKSVLDFKSDIQDLKEDMWLVIECVVIVDPEEHAKAWNDRWLKKYTTALFKKQWGANLMKFSNAVFPGNVSLNGDAIYQAALQEISDLEDELTSTYEYPVDFFMA